MRFAAAPVPGRCAASIFSASSTRQRLVWARCLSSSSANPMFDLTGRNALVTGGARDIGGACAVELARAGANVVVNYYGSHAAAQETVQMIEGLGRRATCVRANVFEAEGIAHLVSEAEAFYAEDGGRIDILVNNAGGLNLRGELCDEVMTEELMMDNLNMNFVSTAMMCKAVIPGMKDRGFGRIINMGSIAGNNGGSGTTTPHYGPAKAAVAAFGRSLAQVRVVIIDRAAAAHLLCPSLHDPLALSSEICNELIEKIIMRWSTLVDVILPSSCRHMQRMALTRTRSPPV